MPVWKPQGLSAQTRSAEDNRQIQLQGTDYKEPVNTGSLSVPSDISTYTPFSVSDIPAVVEYNEAMSRGYSDILADYTEQTERPYTHSEVERNIKDIAHRVSPYYRKYGHTDYMTFDTEDWVRLSNEYNARKDVFGEQEASSWLQGQIQDNVASNQGILEKYWNGFRGLGASTYGALVGVAGNLYGAAMYLTGNGSETEGLNGWQNFINNVMDNEVTRYGNDAVKYGSWRPEKIEEAKALYGGISNIPILATEEQERTIFNINTVPEALAQGGFTAATMLVGAGEAKLANWAFKGVKKATLAAKAGKTLDNLSDAKRALTTVQKVEKGVYAFGLPALAGTHEGLIEGLNTKLNVLEQAKMELARQQEYYVTERAKQLIAENPGMDYSVARNMAFNEYGDKYEESLEYIEAMASKAGINNFYANSAINGVLNATLKAGLQAPKVQGALQSSKLTSWAFPSGKFNVTGTVGNAKVTPKFGIAKQVFNVIKEPFGEFTEEYLQSISDAAMSGAGEYTISRYIENKYNGDSVVDIGDYMSNSFAAGWTALTNAATDKQTIKAGVYGAISSALGTIGPVRSTTRVDRDGNIVYKRNPDGSLVRDSRGRPVAETTFFGRGLNAEGKVESRWEAFSRVMPWRSGLYSQFKATRNEAHRLNVEAGIIEDWINDPKNQEKFDGVVGTLSWAKDMESSAASSDEFEYRNSTLGKTINDALMLEKLKGTAFYESYMQNLTIAANAEMGTEEADDIIASVRQNVNTASDFEGMTDEQVLSTIKSNANRMLNTISTIQSESDNIERILGNVDEDTKMSLIYGKMAMDDWNERSSQLNSEIQDISRNIENTVENSDLTAEQKASVAGFGSFRKAQKTLEKIREVIKSLEEDIKNLESRKGTVASEKRTLKAKKAKYNTLKKKEAEIANSLADSEVVDNTVLSESEIMALPADVRAVMLNPDNLSNYSAAQQEVIKNIINKGTALNIDFSSKIQDVGRMSIASKAYLSQYNSILSDPEAFNSYVAKQREAANDAITNKKYESLSQITDYTQFATELDNIYDTGTRREQQLIEHHLRRDFNENFAKYEKQRDDMRNLIQQIVEDNYFDEMDENDIDMFMHTLSYLANKGIDIRNAAEASQALLERDADGNFLFEKYVSDVNSKLPENDRVEFTSIEEAIQNYVDALNRNNKDNTEREKVEQPIIEDTEVAETPPPAPVEVEVQNVSEEVVEEAETIPQTPETSPQGENIPAENEAIKVALRLVNNLPRFGQFARAIAERIINNAALDVTPTTLGEYLNAEANKLIINSVVSTDFEAADLLRQIATRVLNISEKEIKETIEENTQPNIFRESKSRASAMESLDMSYIMSKYPDSALTRFYKRYKVKEFLEKDVLTKNTPIVFFSDPQLVSEVKEEMQASGKKYTLNSIPIVAMVEVESGGIYIEGKHYQPIAIMPATDNQISAGAARMSEIRKNAYRQSDEAGVSLIKDESGNVITANMYGNVVAKAPNHLQVSEDNRSAQTLQINDLEAEERQQLEELPKTERRKNPIYKRIKQHFLSRLKVVNNRLVYEVPNLKGEVTPFSAFITPVHRTVDRNSDKTIAELFNDNDLSVLTSNSRLERAAKTLVRFFKENFNTENFAFEQDADGVITPTEQTVALLESYAKQLGRSLGNFLNLPARQGWKYEITPTNTMFGERRMYALSIVDNEGNAIFLGNVTNGEMSANTQMSILKNLIMDENGEVRMRDSKNSFVVWNVNYSDVGSEETIAKDNMSRIYDDDIIEFSKDSLSYTIKGVTINAPFTLTGDPNYFKPTIKKRAEVQQEVPATDIPNGNTVSEGPAVIDSDTGAIIEGTTQPVDEVPQQQTKPGAIRDRRRKKPSITQPKVERTIPNKFKWGMFEGANMSVSEITEALNAQGITTEEQWNNRTEEEMERVLKCMGAL